MSKVFPNMAGNHNCDEALQEELALAGIEAHRMPFELHEEVPTHIIGGLHSWTFKRAWYYWRCSGPGIPPDIAEKLHETHGKVVRVDGHCGCPSPREWFKGFACGHYHVDTQDGLNALAKVIREVAGEQ